MNAKLKKKQFEANRLDLNIKDIEKIQGKSDMTRRARLGLKILLDEIKELKKKPPP